MDWHSYARDFPMAPMGGVFLAIMGLSVLAGALFPSRRQLLVWAGFGAGSLSFFFSGRLALGLSHPTRLQIGALALAILLEIVAFRLVMPKLRPQGERSILVGTLAIVGVHFFIMTPSFGPLVLLLAALCTINAALAWRNPAFSSAGAWALDGLFKLGLGSALLLTSPLFVSQIS